MKTSRTTASVADFLNSIPAAQTREDCRKIARMMASATGAAPKMWGPSIVGFGHHLLVYPNGKAADWMQVAFSPRKANITLYLAPEVLRSNRLKKLGRSECGKGCLYLKALADVDATVLRQLIDATVRQRKAEDRLHKTSSPLPAAKSG